ncbi:MAG: hypothetical protein LBP59_13985, partial [Planctomycetaceae bacterium]|nr:hypothetical protein [Planctomycetaceae bacterium]
MSNSIDQNKKKSWLISIRAILVTIPNMIVFLLIAATIYVGHRTDWKAPKFSELTGNGATIISDW